LLSVRCGIIGDKSASVIAFLVITGNNWSYRKDRIGLLNELKNRMGAEDTGR
jgi:hypothetical protein